jgi:Holliday junction resolvase RusA-like endonuclease
MLDSLQHAQIYRDDSQIKELHFYMLEPYRNRGKMIISLQEKEGESEV